MGNLITKIALRRDVLSAWTAKNPILKAGELAIVIDDNGYENLKIGNGISAFNELEYLNLNRYELKTDSVITKDITARSIAQGYNVHATPTSLATGIFTEASADFGVVHGIEAKILSGDNYAFVFNGENLPGITDRYTSHGEGTFNVNPLNGLSGFYIGETPLATTLNAKKTIFIKDSISTDVETLKINKVSRQAYDELSSQGLLKEDELYVIESDILDARNNWILNVKTPEVSSDAANKQYVDEHQSSLLNTSIQIIRPYDQHDLNVSVMICENPNMASCITTTPLDSATSSSYFYGFYTNTYNDSEWKQCISSGFGREYNDKPIMLDIPQLFEDISYDYQQLKHLYLKYVWYYTEDNVNHFSDPYSLVLPSVTEVGANVHDVASKREFNTIKAIVTPEVRTATIESDYINVYNDRFSEITNAISSGTKITLNSYDFSNTYRMSFKTAESATDISVDFYVDLGNGPEKDNTLNINSNKFIANCDYTIEIKHDSIVVESVNKTDVVNYLKRNSNNTSLRVQVIRPYDQHDLNLSIMVCENPEMTACITQNPIDSAVSSQFFYGFYANTFKDSEWKQCTSQGFGREYNDKPIMFDVPQLFNAISYDYQNIDHLYFKYVWYYTEDDTKHFSDPYSLILPSVTEVGANVHDVASKREFNTIKAIVTPEVRTASLEYNYINVYSDRFSEITSTISNGSKITLNSYDFSNSYRMSFKTTDSSDNISVDFYVDYGNGPEKDDTLNINTNKFLPSCDYTVEIKHDCIIIESLNKTDVVNYLKENSNSVTLKVW